MCVYGLDWIRGWFLVHWPLWWSKWYILAARMSHGALCLQQFVDGQLHPTRLGHVSDYSPLCWFPCCFKSHMWWPHLHQWHSWEPQLWAAQDSGLAWWLHPQVWALCTPNPGLSLFWPSPWWQNNAQNMEPQQGKLPSSNLVIQFILSFQNPNLMQKQSYIGSLYLMHCYGIDKHCYGIDKHYLCRNFLM